VKTSTTSAVNFRGPRTLLWGTLKSMRIGSVCITLTENECVRFVGWDWNQSHGTPSIANRPWRTSNSVEWVHRVKRCTQAELVQSPHRGWSHKLCHSLHWPHLFLCCVVGGMQTGMTGMMETVCNLQHAPSNASQQPVRRTWRQILSSILVDTS
jgi:hypothetical protein